MPRFTGIPCWPVQCTYEVDQLVLVPRLLLREAVLILLLIDIDHNKHLDIMLSFSFAKVAQGSNE